MATVIYEPKDTRAQELGVGLGQGLQTFAKTAVGTAEEQRKTGIEDRRIIERRLHELDVLDKQIRSQAQLQEALLTARGEESDKDRQLRKELQEKTATLQRELADERNELQKRLTQMQIRATREEAQLTRQQRTWETGVKMGEARMERELKRELAAFEGSIDTAVAQIKAGGDAAVLKKTILHDIVSGISNMYKYKDPEEAIASFLTRIAPYAKEAGITIEELEQVAKEEGGLFSKLLDFLKLLMTASGSATPGIRMPVQEKSRQFVTPKNPAEDEIIWNP